MEKKIETLEIVAEDRYGDNCLNDSCMTGKRNSGKPEGFVTIYEVDDSGDRKLVGKHNLVLYQGREWLAQKIVHVENPNVSSEYAEYITWFGLGDGGVNEGDPLVPAPPTLTDTELNERIMIIASDSSAADYHIEGEIDPNDGYEYPETGNYKIPFDSVDFEQDSLNDDQWLVVRIVTTIGVNHANDKQISEAGLYTASSGSGGYGGPFHLFSRVTFPSIVKTEDRRLIFTWYLYV